MCLLHHLLQQVWVEGGGVTLVDSSYVEDPERFSNASTSYDNIKIDKMHGFCFGLIKLTAHSVTSYIV